MAIRLYRLLMIGSLISTVLCHSAAAHNGAVAVAVPVEGITVDGDLSDWPALQVYPIRQNTEAYGPTDLRGVDLDTSQDFSPALFRRNNDLLTYEWGLQLLGSSLEDTLRLELGMSLGFDVVAVDRDPGEGLPAWVAWTPHAKKITRPATLGDLILAGDPSSLGTVSGKVVNAKEGTPRAGLVINACSAGRPIASARTDAAGRYHLPLVPGDYVLRPGTGQSVEPFALALTVGAGEQVEVNLAAVPAPILARLSFWVRPDAAGKFTLSTKKESLPFWCATVGCRRSSRRGQVLVRFLVGSSRWTTSSPSRISGTP